MKIASSAWLKSPVSSSLGIFNLDRKFKGGSIQHAETYAISDDGDWQKTVVFNEFTGVILSLNEKVIPDAAFSSTTGATPGVSAISGIQTAASEGQQIYFIDSTNIANSLPNLSQGSDVISDITNGVNAGQQVIVPQATITNSGGWQGTGYVILDPQTGAGAYLISGQANGNALELPSIILTIFGIDIGAKSTLLLNESGRDLVDKYFLGPLTAIAFAVGILTDGLKCAASSNVSTVLLSYTAMSLGGLAFMSFITGFLTGLLGVLTLGPLIGLFLLGVALDFFIDWLNDKIVESLCFQDRARKWLGMINATRLT